MRRTRVVAADDHPVILLGVRHALDAFDDIALLAQARQSTELVESLRRMPVDVVVTDLAMPCGRYGDGLTLIGYLRRHFPTVRIVVLTMLGNGALLRGLFEAGVAAVVGKGDDLAHIGLAVRHAMKDVRYVSPSLRAVLERGAARNGRANDPIALSPREIEVLRLFASGLSVSEIAARLNRSVKTVSSHKVAALRKLGVASDAELIEYARANGLAHRAMDYGVASHEGEAGKLAVCAGASPAHR
ncbi:LuxR C-terminal-related transcriptional regulator [Trinickia diaoshuihuensis]|jgi:two-component system capsular synthesis response regulator RcsB|uniref:LuxR C-terminal-related transcriptional regulator n=1 Tax=Trinickia diaoshuihuensis TaxID=2292265 RepID=UPI000E25CD92|nr:LuxR C-terminal-related transcriptional regulator [Trinickia diaoshuihuensis]